MPALEMNVFIPDSRHSAPSRAATVATAARSEPASGSVTAKAHSTSPAATAGSQRLRWTSLPASPMGHDPSPCMAKAVSASDEK
jgi:hypothetical protein